MEKTTKHPGHTCTELDPITQAAVDKYHMNHMLAELDMVEHMHSKGYTPETIYKVLQLDPLLLREIKEAFPQFEEGLREKLDEGSEPKTLMEKVQARIAARETDEAIEARYKRHLEFAKKFPGRADEC